MAEWKSRRHLEDHFGIHRREFPGYSIDQYDASAQETIILGNQFRYRDPVTRERRVGYFHRDSARFAALDIDGFVHSHFRTDEAYVVELPMSTYRD